FAVLVEIDGAEPVGLLDGAGVRRQLADDHPQKGGLARAVGAEDAEAHARREQEIEAVDDAVTAERLAQSFADPESLALPLGRREFDARGGDARALAALLQLADQASGVIDARLRLRRPRLRAAAQPLHLAAHQIGQS